MKSYPPALILDLSATGLAVARILSKHGVDAYGADIYNLSIGRFSKYVKRPSFGYKVSLDSRFLDQLIKFAKKFDTKPVLFPSSDVFIEFVSKHYEILKKYYHLQESLAPNISNKFLNKMEFYKLCEKYNMVYPKTLILTGKESPAQVIEKLRFPIILKPHLIHKWRKHLKGKKVIYIKNLSELENVFKVEKDLLVNSVLQEVIPGPEENIFIFKGYFDRKGNLKAHFVGRKIRQYPPYFGSFSLAESVENEEVKKLSVDFLQRLKFKGLCGTEFKYDYRDRDYKIIEINIRPQLWEDLTRLAGAEVLWVAYCDLAGLESPQCNKQINYVKLSYLIRDIYSAFIQIKDGELKFKKWIQSYSNLRGDAIFEMKDWKLLIGFPLYVMSQFYFFKIRPVFAK